MSGFYTRDKVLITPITKAPGTGAITPGTPVEVSVMAEDETQTITGGNGRPVESNIYFFMPSGTVVKIGDYVQVIERFGKTVTEKERIVLQVSPYGDLSESHREVYA